MTREEAIKFGEKFLEVSIDLNYTNAYQFVDKALKLLKQESAIDKIRTEILDTLYVDSLIFGELINFKNGKISADDVIDKFNQITRLEVLKIIDKYKIESERDEK